MSYHFIKKMGSEEKYFNGLKTILLISKRCHKGLLSGIGGINAGVTQKHVLGPFLFFIYINDKVKIIGNQI